MKRLNFTNYIRLGLAIMLLSLISACGQKGDLYLPPEEVGSQTSLIENIV